ncbi:MAG TPA: 4-coumarate--CoA ligase family protein [Chloroflexota bacterium]|nr:4-coumarate--CoA ligase family protein [Chloroflexota bacterium]
MSTDVAGPNAAQTFRSHWPDVEIPETPFAPFVLRRAAELGSKTAIVDGPSGRSYTYAQFADAVHRVAFGLTRRGFGKGDVFAIYSPNLPEYAIAFFGVALVGGVVTTINPLATAEELASQLRDAGATRLVTVPPFLEKAREAAGQTGIREVFVFGEAEGATPFAALLAEDGPLPEVQIDPREDVVVLPYSSGTTGLPKGVMLTHYNLVANLVQSNVVVPAGQDDVLIAILPFFHIYGMVVLMGLGLYCGATIVSLPRFDLEQFLQTMECYRVTRALVVPPIVLALAKHPLVDKFDLSSVRGVLSGAAPLGLDVAEACATRLGCIVKQGYGLTETSPVTHANEDETNRAGSVGRALPNTECKIVSVETGEAVGPGEPGEVCVRGPQVMKGYLNQPDATAQTIDEDGWLHTADVGQLDADGYLYIVDRIKELIKYKGYQVAPAELEALLAAHPSIADAAVIGVPDEEAGEVPKAFVVLKGKVSADEVMGYVAERVSPYKRIRLLEIVDQIPRSASGKILRRVLIEQERERAAAR